MIEIKINGKIGLGIQPNINKQDIKEIMTKIDENDKVIFVDLATTAGIEKLFKKIQQKAEVVGFFDHHLDGINKQDYNRSMKIMDLLGNRAKIVSREDHPSCVTLIEKIHFTKCIFHGDPDGLFSFLKASDISYLEMESDAETLDESILVPTISEEGSIGSIGVLPSSIDFINSVIVVHKTPPFVFSGIDTVNGASIFVVFPLSLFCDVGPQLPFCRQFNFCVISLEVETESLFSTE
jgi:hypothetical protein